jgi:hypothetical protein
MKSNFQKFPLLVSIVLLILSCAVFYFLYNKIEQNRASVENMSIEVQKEAQRVEELRLLDRGLRSVEQERVQVESHFAESANLVPFLDGVEELATKVGAEVETTSVDVSANKSNLLVGVKTEGSFEALYKFLTLLENSPYELEIVFLDMSKQEAGAWVMQIRLKLISFIN